MQIYWRSLKKVWQIISRSWPKMIQMRQNEIWYADLNPSKGSEQHGFRPVVIISGNLMNEYLNTIICCPLTTKIKNYKGNVVLDPDNENQLKARSEILTAHIRIVSK